MKKFIVPPMNSWEQKPTAPTKSVTGSFGLKFFKERNYFTEFYFTALLQLNKITNTT